MTVWITLIGNDLRGAKNEFQLTDGLQLMLERGEKMQAVEIDWIDCGKVDALLYANRTLLARNENQFSVAGTKDVIFIPPVWIGKNTNLKNSVIGPYVSVGDGVQITECIIKNSIIDANATLSASVFPDQLLASSQQ